MAIRGWKQLVVGADSFAKSGRYPIAAYSEFMPPPRLGRKPYDAHVDTLLFNPDDPWGWHISEYEQAFELEPGLCLLAREIMGAVRRLGRGESAQGIAHNKLLDNVYWPDELARAGAPAAERYVLLLSLALARTQDDKGHVRWTLFGGSEQGPSRAFWRGFYSDPRTELPLEQSLDFIRRLLHAAYGERLENLTDLARAGFRVLPSTDGAPLKRWNDETLPSWTEPYVWSPRRGLGGVKYLLTFCPFARLPAAARRAYLAGALHLLPFPGSLVFWGAPKYLELAEHLPLATQIPLLHSCERHAAPFGIRVPQSGWMHEPRPGAPPHSGPEGPLRNSYRRTHRMARVRRDEDELAISSGEDHVAHVLFSTDPNDLGLYGKPMARNAQIWTRELEPLLDGPRSTRHQLARACQALGGGGLFGYRFLFPAMRVVEHEVYWQRPLVAFFSKKDDAPHVVREAPLGYLTAYRASRPEVAKPIELWPRLLERNAYRTAVTAFGGQNEGHHRRTVLNIRKVLDCRRLWGQPLEESFARGLLNVAREQTWDGWLDSLRAAGENSEIERLIDELRASATPAPADKRQTADARPTSLTFSRTATRAFEKDYWRTIADLSTGRFITTDNADCSRDPATQAVLKRDQRDLEALGDYLLAYYAQLVRATRTDGKVLFGELAFKWHTDFDYGWQGGWLENQAGRTHERDLIVVIPGQDRTRAVIMADHYDTAYMEDAYGYGHGGRGPRLASAGADDNHSATATLMLGARNFIELSRQKRLECDVWLVHLTGEEFPSDCMGARHLCQCLVEGTLRMKLAGSRRHKDLSKTRVRGIYVLDMVAHNNDHDRDVFQICPGTSRASLWLAYQAHLASRNWNALAPAWNRKPARRNRGRGVRSADPRKTPAIAAHPRLSGEVRPAFDPRSTLYNTDGQIFSDAGVPVVLFMENYDINRHGYHDTHDTMENIDLDYGSAVAAIAIEAVARAATEPPP
jgi:hypothetical protein